MKKIIFLILSILCTANLIYGNDSTSVNCRADFSYSYNHEIMCFVACSPIQFSDNSKGEAVQWLWDFGDGNTSGEKNPLHIYTFLPDNFGTVMPEEIKVCLKVIFADSCISEQCKVVSLRSLPEKCHVFFQPYRKDSVISIPEIIPYSFDVQVPENTVQWLWDFGDGTASDEPFPVHGYNFMGGLYTICLTIVTADSCTQTYCTDLYVGSPDTIVIPDCQAGFTYNILESNPVQYAFYDNSSGDPEGWFWDFGDGSYSTEPDPVHVFERKPLYDSIPPDYSNRPDFAYRVCLTITTQSGCTSTYCQYISAPYDTIVTNPCEYKIRLNTSNILGLPCSGTASASLYDPIGQQEIPASIYWSMDVTGNSVSGLCANVPYYVVLTSPDGCTVAGSFAVMDYSVPVFNTGYWTYSGKGNEYRFIYNTADSSYQCFWDFGDGTVLQGNDIAYEMMINGNNSVDLTVYDMNGNLVHSEEIKISNAATGVTGPVLPAARIYPNPAYDHLCLELKDNNYEFIDFIVVDMTGRQVLSHRLFQNDNGIYNIDISNLPHGIYLTRILYGNQQLGIDKFIK
jgi:PKD repeat protein